MGKSHIWGWGSVSQFEMNTANRTLKPGAVIGWENWKASPEQDGALSRVWPPGLT